jgi:hypothetical protein
MLILKRSGLLTRTSVGAAPLEAWRAAAQLVWARWEAFLRAPAEARAGAYDAYLAALDAEAAAAAVIAGAPSTTRA